MLPSFKTIAFCFFVQALSISLCSCAQTTGSVEQQRLDTLPVSRANKSTTMLDYHPSLAKAHPKAKPFLNTEWHYSPIDDLAPFGSDDAADTYHSFVDWRQQHPTTSPKEFIVDHLNRWGYSSIDLQAAEYSKLKPFLEENELGSRLLFGIDASILATAFGQLYLEGRIDPEMKRLASFAIQREQLPQILNSWNELKEIREKRLTEFSKILEACE